MDEAKRQNPISEDPISGEKVFIDLEKVSEEKDSIDLEKTKTSEPEEKKEKAKKEKAIVKVIASEFRSPSDSSKILVNIRAIEADGSTVFFQDKEGNPRYIKLESSKSIDEADEELDEAFGEVLFGMYPDGWVYEIEKICF